MQLCFFTADGLTAIATAVLAAGTIILAGVAIFQDTIHRWVYPPTLEASVQARPPDCVMTYSSTHDGKLVADMLYLRIWVKNIGKASAKLVEVYANELVRKRADGEWERVIEFPPMNLK